MTHTNRDETLEYYNVKTNEFYESTVNADVTALYERFISEVKPGGKILDFGCGSGRDTKAFIDKGYVVDAVDGSEEMCKMASEYTGIKVKCMDFFDLDSTEEYDAIWACASLLHVEREKLPLIIDILRKALVNSGVLYMSFKYGDHNGMRDERHFTDMNEDIATELLNKIRGFETIDMWQSDDVRREKEVHWLNLLLRKETMKGRNDKNQ